jgi:hypothetical protein
MSNRPVDFITCDPACYADYVERMTPAAREKALQAFERATDPVAARFVRQKVALLRAAIASDGATLPPADAVEPEGLVRKVPAEVGGL